MSSYRVSKYANTVPSSDYHYEAVLNNLPIIGNLRRSAEDVRFAQDFYKNTGRNIQYPGRFFSNGIRNGAMEAMSLGFGGIRGLTRWL